MIWVVVTFFTSKLFRWRNLANQLSAKLQKNKESELPIKKVITGMTNIVNISYRTLSVVYISFKKSHAQNLYLDQIQLALAHISFFRVRRVVYFLKPFLLSNLKPPSIIQNRKNMRLCILRRSQAGQLGWKIFEIGVG